jgi:hypothetical protein
VTDSKDISEDLNEADARIEQTEAKKEYDSAVYTW